MIKKFSIEVIGDNGTKWSFNIYEEEKYWKQWVDAGLNIMLVEDEIPEWIVALGMIKPYLMISRMLRVF